VSEPRCDDPANGLLPWYLNGTLAADDEARVRTHLDACASCSDELDALSEVARGLPDLPPLPTPGTIDRSRRFRRTPWFIAASLAVPALLGIYWAGLGFPRGRAELRPAVDRSGRLGLTAVVNLGTGPMRGVGPNQVLVLTPGVERIVATFRLPILPEAPLALELQDANGSVLARGSLTRGWDEQLDCAYSFAAAALSGAGEYALVVRDPASGRSYPFPFSVEVRTR
jgi:hypothetical protein